MKLSCDPESMRAVTVVGISCSVCSWIRRKMNEFVGFLGIFTALREYSKERGASIVTVEMSDSLSKNPGVGLLQFQYF